MVWQAIAEDGELQVNQMKRVEAGGRKLLLCRAESGHYCVDEMCSHEDYSLWFGCIKGDTIKCSLHGSYFSLADGRPLNEPADCPLRTYPVKSEQGRIWVELS
ncbi:non-heme iron oxygenase ferredoxin subunit [Parasulfuritortus cantonensis]|uniref:Non-heme iron oxygenase ferredoxin subunit n=1 Tax=Parasulfuritortus cantonensis TaxID=2528202 RepID=A0A4R1BQC0_9PROT|nr:non-heme iron oxygenase ferredoxin subunit [Parasulfuritortus cantonensis]TCJ19781.1 non-heme iron oxygenase ferredoxin subunit [Parasulfuritortus cantonensis]